MVACVMKCEIRSRKKTRIKKEEKKEERTNETRQPDSTITPQATVTKDTVKLSVFFFFFFSFYHMDIMDNKGF